MVDYGKLRKKFQAKNPNIGKKSPKTAVKAIAREYEMKKAELAAHGAPSFRRGAAFYGFIVLLLLAVGGLVVPKIRNGELAFGKKRIERADLNVRKAIDSLTVALGRYKFHVGGYPTAEEGLAVLAYRKPKEIRSIRAKHRNWDGPYVDHIVQDPWKNDYVYEPRPDGGHPILYSKGPDGKAGTADDVLSDESKFDLPFLDPSWTNRWAPCELRGIVVAPDEETKRRVQKDMEQYKRK